MSYGKPGALQITDPDVACRVLLLAAMILRESLDGGTLKGGVLLSRLRWVGDFGIPGGLGALRPKVSPATATILYAPILPISSYPFRALIEIDRGIASVLGTEERSVVARLGRYSAWLNLTTSFKHYKGGEPHDLFASAARMHRQYQDFGREEYERTGESSGRVSLLDNRCYSKTYCWSACGYFEQATRLHGGLEPLVTETECVCSGDGACRFEIAWRVGEKAHVLDDRGLLALKPTG